MKPEVKTTKEICGIEFGLQQEYEGNPKEYEEYMETKWVSCESEIEFLKQYQDVFNELFLMYNSPILKTLEKMIQQRIKQLKEGKE